MKLPRLRTLAAAGTVAGTLAGAVMLTAPQASAMQTDQWVSSCMGEGGRIGFGTFYDYDVNGNVVSTAVVVTCRIGSHVYWNDTDINGEPVGGLLVRSTFRIACRAHFGPGLWPGPRRQARWVGRGIREGR